MSCPECHDEGVRELAATDHVSGERFEVRRSGCGLAFTSPVPGDLDLYYPTDYYAYGLTGVSLAEKIRWAGVIRVAHRIQGTGKGLDAGCGAGRLAAALQRRGWKMTGVDPSKPAIEAVRSQGMRGYVGAIEDVPEDGFDAVVFNHSLEHVRDPVGTLETALQKLRPGGALHVAVPNYGGWQARILRGRWFQLDLPRHLVHFDRDSLTGLVRAAGFKQIEVRTLSMTAGPSQALRLSGRLGRLVSYGLYGPLIALDPLGGGDCLNLRAKR